MLMEKEIRLAGCICGCAEEWVNRKTLEHAQRMVLG
jgi:hypothetical protein